MKKPTQDHNAATIPGLDQIRFPKSHAELVRFFESGDTDPAFRERMAGLPDRVYETMDDFRVAFGEELDNYASVKKNADNAVRKNPTAR